MQVVCARHQSYRAVGLKMPVASLAGTTVFTQSPRLMTCDTSWKQKSDRHCRDQSEVFCDILLLLVFAQLTDPTESMQQACATERILFSMLRFSFRAQDKVLHDGMCHVWLQLGQELQCSLV